MMEGKNLQLGTKAPDFFLFDVVTQKNWSLSQIIGEEKKPFLIIVMCNHCPYVKHVEEEIASIAKTYAERIAVAAISASDVADYPDDSPDNLKAQAERLGFNFPYFYDDRQATVKELKAVCTPDFYLYNKELELAYHGQLDESRPGNNLPVTGKDLRDAIDIVLIEQNPSSDQTPSQGCSIKWKPGNEPDYIKS